MDNEWGFPIVYKKCKICGTAVLMMVGQSYTGCVCGNAVSLLDEDVEPELESNGV